MKENKKELSEKEYKKEIKKIYNQKCKEQADIENRRQKLQDLYQNNTIEFIALINRYKCLKYEKIFAPSNYSALLIGILSGGIASSFLDFSTQFNLEFLNIIGFLIFFVVTAFWGLTCYGLLAFFAKNYRNIFLSNKNLFIVSFEIKLIEAKMREEYGFIVDLSPNDIALKVGVKRIKGTNKFLRTQHLLHNAGCTLM